MKQASPKALIVAGPTASGKSALALKLAEHLNGTIINADSMQVYQELRILTARPTQADEARAPHRLYGTQPASQPGSVAQWREAALTAMQTAHKENRLPIICGGTGLYFLSLTQGLADIPPIPPQARAEARALLAEIGPAALHARLAQADPATAAQLHPQDGQRLARAWEVFLSTGQGLAHWHTQNTGPAPWQFAAILLDPPRPDLREAIATRFATMLTQGALEETRALLAQNLSPALPAMRAHGVPELAAHLRGEIPLTEAERRASLATGQYTKRQATWFRHHKLSTTGPTHIIHARVTDHAQFSERESPEIFAFVQNRP